MVTLMSWMAAAVAYRVHIGSAGVTASALANCNSVQWFKWSAADTAHR